MVPTTRLLIVCTAAVQTQMNATLAQIDPTSTGDVMTVGLALPSDASTAVGYWTSWAMLDEHRVAILRAYGQQGWRPLRGSEGVVLGPVDAVPAWGTQRFWLFDGTTVPYSDVLAALGLMPVEYPS